VPGAARSRRPDLAGSRRRLAGSGGRGLFSERRLHLLGPRRGLPDSAGFAGRRRASGSTTCGERLRLSILARFGAQGRRLNLAVPAAGRSPCTADVAGRANRFGDVERRLVTRSPALSRRKARRHVTISPAASRPIPSATKTCSRTRGYVVVRDAAEHCCHRRGEGQARGCIGARILRRPRLA